MRRVEEEISMVQCYKKYCDTKSITYSKDPHIPEWFIKAAKSEFRWRKDKGRYYINMGNKNFDRMELYHAKFVICTKDLSLSIYDGGAWRRAFTCGYVYEIKQSSYGSLYVDCPTHKYFLPIGSYNDIHNVFYEHFIIVDKASAEVEPYTSIRKLNQKIDDIKEKCYNELKPIVERYNKETKQIHEREEKELSEVENELRALNKSIGR